MNGIKLFILKLNVWSLKDRFCVSLKVNFLNIKITYRFIQDNKYLFFEVKHNLLLLKISFLIKTFHNFLK